MIRERRGKSELVSLLYKPVTVLLTLFHVLFVHLCVLIALPTK
jgi:hypothetical protein